MRKILSLVFKILLITIVVLWIGLIFVEAGRYKKDESMLVVLKEETLNYDDGHVYVYYGLGYKKIVYERLSINGKQFGHIFTTVREKVDK